MEHKIFIDVSTFGIEKKKRVQDAFFKLGYMWLKGGYQYLSAKSYTAVNSNGEYGRLLYSHYYNYAHTQQQPHVKTYNELMEIAGMPEYKEEVEATASATETAPSNNTFTKSMLKSGEHILETREGERFIVAGDYLLGSTDYDHLGSVTDTLEDVDKNTECDIVKVYSGKVFKGINIVAGKGVLNYLKSDSLTLIWQRESPEEAQKRLQREEKLAEIQSLKEEVKRAQEALEAAEKELEE